MPPTLYLLDGHALAYRAYFAITRGSSSFSTRGGEPTAGVFGFTSILLRLFEQERPEYLAVAFDTGKTFRDKLFSDYKATRAKMPDDLRPQIARIRQIVDAFAIPRVEIEGYEADDVLGTLARRMAGEGFGVKIFTGDRDLLQLVNERILINLPGKTLSEAKDYRPADVKNTMGVRPDQIVDYKALVGDKSDNIPGVAGIGEKSAVQLLETYGTLDAIYANLDNLPQGMRKKLSEGRAAAEMSRQLATIVTDVALKFEVESARTGRFDLTKVDNLFRELEFRSLVGRLENVAQIYHLGRAPSALEAAAAGQQLALFATSALPAADTEPAVPVEPVNAAAEEIIPHVVDAPDTLIELVNRLNAAGRIAFDTETTGTDAQRADLVGISLAVDQTHGYYIPVGHRAELGTQLPLDTVLEALRGPMTRADIPKIGHNVKYDFVTLARQGLRVAPLGFDTMIAEWLTNPTSHNLGLKGLAWARLALKMTEIETLIGKGKDQRTMAEAPISQAASYAAADAVVTLRLASLLETDLINSKATRLLEDLEMPLVPVLAEMEMAGIGLDTQFLAQMSAELEKRMKTIEADVHQAVGEPLNLNSTQQLSVALFDRLKLTPPDRTRRTASGHFSTSAEVLDTLRGKHPVVDWVLEYRELSKLRSTYLEALPLAVNPETGRVHTSYNQTGSVTGRIASSDPNLQNIPIRTELGQRVRRAFVAAPGHVLLSVDYSQVELRIVAHLANDEAMLAAFRADQDIHSTTAAAIYGVPLSEVTKAQRRAAKAINFGLIYGMSAFGLTRTTELTLAEAEDFVEAYFRQFPGVKDYLDSVRRQAGDDGYVETLLGRRRYFPTLKHERNAQVRNREEREAINAPVQGTAADIMKIAMLRLPAALSEAGLGARMLLQVHDEVVLECPQGEVRRAAEITRRVMENAYRLQIPLRTEARQGKNWGEMTPLEG